MKRLALVVFLVGCLASAGLAQRTSAHGGLSGHAGSSIHSGFGGVHTGPGAGPARVGGLGPGRMAPPRLSGNRPAQFSRNFPVSPTRGFRQPYTDAGHHRMPYRSPHDRDRDRDRWRGYGWGGFPLWTGWVGPYLPNYPLFYPDDYDQYDSDQAGYDGAQTYPGYGSAEDSQQSTYQDAPYPAPNGYGNAASYYPAPNPSASADQGPPYRPSSQLPQQARAPYYPPSGSMSASVPELPLTVIFKDGRPPEKIHNYLLTASTLSVLDQHRHDIPVNQINLDETARANREAGVDFQVPGPVQP